MKDCTSNRHFIDYVSTGMMPIKFSKCCDVIYLHFILLCCLQRPISSCLYWGNRPKRCGTCLSCILNIEINDIKTFVYVPNAKQLDDISTAYGLWNANHCFHPHEMTRCQHWTRELRGVDHNWLLPKIIDGANAYTVSRGLLLHQT